MNNKLSIGIIGFVALILFSAPASVFGDMSDYCQMPAFINTAVSPNIMLLVDVSGSMGYSAYQQSSDRYRYCSGNISRRCSHDSDCSEHGWGTCTTASSLPYGTCSNDPFINCQVNSDCGSGNTCNPRDMYEGYFRPDKNYVLNLDGIYYEYVPAGVPCTITCDIPVCKPPSRRTSACDTTKGTNGCSSDKYYCGCSHYTYSGDCGDPTSGNLLNYLHMARIDLLRWAMTGGSPSTCNASDWTRCDPRVYNDSGMQASGKVGTVCKDNLQLNSAGTVTGHGCILKADDGTRVSVPWSRISEGLVFQFHDLPIQPRMGAMFFEGTGVKSNYVYVGDFTSANSRSSYTYQNLLTEVNATGPGGYTPTGPAMWDTLNYLSQNNPEYGGIAPQSGSGDAWKNPMYDCPDKGGGNCIFIPCAMNFVLLMSDGLWNQGGGPPAANSCNVNTSYELHSADPVVPAYKMHMGFTNVMAEGAPSQKVSSVYTVGMFISTAGQNALQNTAIYGSFDNSSKTWPSNRTNYPGKQTGDPTNCAITDTGAMCPSNQGTGSNCNALPTSSVDWDKNGDGVPDTYYVADDALNIRNKIMDAILDMLRRTASGTAVSILASGEGSGANLLQAFFYPKKAFEDTDINWVGEMQNLWYYIDPRLQSSTIREDTDTDKELNLQNDYIVHFRFDSSVNKTKADRYNNAGAYQNTVDLEEVKNLWEAGKILWLRNLGLSSRTIHTTLNGTTLTNFRSLDPNNATVRAHLQAADSAEATKIIDYVYGIDQTGYRNRTVTIPAVDSAPRVWKLGDIISSTPKLQSWVALNSYHIAAPYGYGDNAYQKFIKSENYKTRGMVYVGSNDGMLHALKLGMLEMINDPSDYDRVAKLSGTDIGKEEWAFIPKNALPYLKYLTDTNYCHLYYVDASPYLFDASVVKPSDCTEANDWDCEKKTVVDASNNLDLTKTSWRTILIGGMGLGGACRKTGDSCTDCVKTPILDPADNAKGLGYSSYFAIDITDPQNPSLLWEFSDPALGFSTTGPVIVRTGDKNKNGRWFAVFASGPTGPIDTSAQQFYGKSDQYLRIFILDLKTGNLLRTITMDGTGDNPNIPNAFGGSLINTTIDTDGLKPERTGNYQDDVFYVGYVKKCTTTTSVCTSGTWTNGGVLRVTTQVDNPGTSENESLNPNNWKVSTLIDNIGPVTSSIGHLQDRKNHNLWLYFGTGRYFYKIGTDIDDADGQRSIFGIKEPCYNAYDQFDITCTSSVSGLTDATTTLPSTEPENGWYINLDSSGAAYKAERVITNPLAATTGAVFFTTFAPTADICGFGGNTYIWAVKYSTGGGPPSSALRGTAIVQVSTGEIKELPLSSAFTEKSGRRTAGFTGTPPTAQGLSLILPPLPVKRVLHVRER